MPLNCMLPVQTCLPGQTSAQQRSKAASGSTAAPQSLVRMLQSPVLTAERQGLQKPPSLDQRAPQKVSYRLEQHCHFM